MNAREIARRIRPPEWAMLSFTLYAVIRFSTASGALHKGTIPGLTLLAPAFAVIAVRLVMRFREMPWPPGLEDRRRMHGITLVVFMLAGLVPALRLPSLGSAHGNIAPLLASANAWFQSLLLCIVLPLFVWAAYGLHLKRHGRPRLSFFSETLGIAFVELRYWFPPLAMVSAYALMGGILEHPLFPDRDDELWAIDRWLFLGHDPHLLVEHLIRPALSEWLSVAYTSYPILFAIAFGAIGCKRSRLPFQELSFAMTFAFAVGYVLYTIVPAQGPVYTQVHATNLDLYYTGFVKTQLMDRTRIPRDCFPSLHTCVSLIFLWYMLAHVRKVGLFCAPFVLSIPFACVYLRYHYVVDILAGLVLCAIAITLERRIYAVARARRVSVNFPTASPPSQ